MNRGCRDETGGLLYPTARARGRSQRPRIEDLAKARGAARYVDSVRFGPRPRVAIVNQTMVRRLWPNEEPIESTCSWR
jgi:hypothetical protein